MGATMKDIARETGLGLATISSYLNGGNVREKNRIKIEEAIEKLHFEVNEVARGLKTNRTKTIGIILPELNNIFFSEIIMNKKVPDYSPRNLFLAYLHHTVVIFCLFYASSTGYFSLFRRSISVLLSFMSG